MGKGSGRDGKGRVGSRSRSRGRNAAIGARFSSLAKRSRGGIRNRRDGKGGNGAGESGHSSSPQQDNQSGDSDEIATWLKEIEPSGALMRYLPAFKQNFGSLYEIGASKTQEPSKSKSILQCIEPALWKELGVESLGHKLVLARNIVEVSARSLDG